MNEETLRRQLDRLVIHRDNLAMFLDQQARAGGKAHASLAIIGGIRSERDAIRTIKRTLRTAGVEVKDEPDDEEQFVPPPPRGQSSPAVAQAGPERQGGVDVLIIAPLREEREAVRRHLPDCRKLSPSSDDIWVYYESQLPVTFSNGQSGSYRIIVTSPAGMGRTQAASLAGDAIKRWRPRYVMLVGIAGGTGTIGAVENSDSEELDGVTGGVAAQGVQIGDVLIAESIIDYELQKLTSQKPDIRWETHRVDPRLLLAAQNFDDSEWHPLITAARPQPGFPLARFGPIASGDKVIAYSAGLRLLRETWSKLIGVEMEAGGVALRASHAVEHPGFFMVRGVSDLADSEKNSTQVEKWRPYVCDVAAAYTVGLLKSGPFPLV